MCSSKRRLRFLGWLLFCCSPAWGAIAPVSAGSTTTDITTAGTTVTITPSSLTTGDYVAVSIEMSATVTSMTAVDNNSNALTVHPNAASNTWMFYGKVISGATDYKMTWTTSAKAVVTIMEYSGVGAIGSTNNGSGSSTAGTVSVTTTAANSWCPATIGTSIAAITFTSVTGNKREQEETSGLAASIVSGDNTVVSSGGTCTFAETLSTSETWKSLVVEFQPTVAAAVPQMTLLGVGP